MPVNSSVRYLSDPTVLRSLREGLATYLEQQRWFTSKGQGISSVELEVLPAFGDDGVITLVHLEFDRGEPEVRVLPVSFVDRVDGLPAGAVICQAATADGPRHAIDAVHGAGFRESLYTFLASDTTAENPGGRLIAERGPLLEATPRAHAAELPPQHSSNTVIVYRPDGFLKLFRKTEPGLHPDAELIGYLSADCGFAAVPAFGGALHFHRHGDAEPSSLALMLGRVEHRGEAWDTMLSQVGAFAKTVERLDLSRFELDTGLLEPLREDDLDLALLGAFGEGTVERVIQLGERTAEMHLHFGAATEQGLQAQDLDASYWVAAKTQLLARVKQEQQLASAELSRDLDAIGNWLENTPLPTGEGGLIRVHGDYHLGQVLVTEDDVVVIDFEGEPLHSLAYRRRRHPAFKDVAGMLRSLHYAPNAFVLQHTDLAAKDLAVAKAWYTVAARLYVTAYLRRAAGASFLPENARDTAALLGFFLADKALYELAYERASRPDWLRIPEAGIAQVASLLRVD